MSDLHALVRACKAEPEDDAPRLILADWLDEHDEEERATFIRRQIAEPNLSSEQLAPNPLWFGEWMNCGASFHRGLLHVYDHDQKLYEKLATILATAFDWIWVEHLSIGGWQNGACNELLRSPKFLELNSLGFSFNFNGANRALPLSESRFLSNLKHLHIFGFRNGDELLRQLSQSSSLNSLRFLEFGGTNIGRRGARTFAESKQWANLRVCSFYRNHFTDSALSEFTHGRLKLRLESLDLRDGLYTDRGLVFLSSSDRFPNLRKLRIGYTENLDDPSPVFGPFGVETLLNAASFKLERLQVQIISHLPVPRDILELVDRYPDRLFVPIL